MCVWLIHMWSTAAVDKCATYNSTAYTYSTKPMHALVRTRTSLGKVNSSRGDDFESDDDQNNPA